MADPVFDIERLTSNPFSRVVLAIPQEKEATGGTTVVGWIKDPFSFGGQSEFQNPEANAGQETLTKAVNASMSVANSFFGANARQQVIKHVGQTIQSWTGSSPPALTLPLEFVAIRPGDDPREDVKKLLRCVYPTIEGIRVIAPLGYSINPRATTAVGSVTMTIGTWLRIPNLIVKSVDFTFSVEVISSGVPLQAEGTVMLEPYKMLSITDVEGFFLPAV